MLSDVLSGTMGANELTCFRLQRVCGSGLEGASGTEVPPRTPGRSNPYTLQPGLAQLLLVGLPIALHMEIHERDTSD
jgi:hypothetical protein